ncbi:hypothetical protein J6590_040845 [Homalodisca vitripennis]|nr:hypothetical protein J6590_040845 [Homalodisca vitripennis]
MGSEDNKAEAAIKKKDYDMKLRSVTRLSSKELINSSSNKSRTIWTTINKERAVREADEGISWQLNITVKMINDLTKVADQFNMYFITSVAEDH